jgi:hypothetical protein
VANSDPMLRGSLVCCLLLALAICSIGPAQAHQSTYGGVGSALGTDRQGAIAMSFTPSKGGRRNVGVGFFVRVERVTHASTTPTEPEGSILTVVEAGGGSCTRYRDPASDFSGFTLACSGTYIHKRISSDKFDIDALLRRASVALRTRAGTIRLNWKGNGNLHSERSQPNFDPSIELSGRRKANVAGWALGLEAQGRKTFSTAMIYRRVSGRVSPLSVSSGPLF